MTVGEELGASPAASALGLGATILRQEFMRVTNCPTALMARVLKPVTSLTRSIAPQRLVPWATAQVCICFTLLSPIARGGTFTMRVRLTSSAGLEMVRR